MSSSRSSSAASTWQQDNRRVIGEGGISAEGGSNVNYSVVNNTLDGDAINRAFQFGERFGTAALDLSSDALGFGEGAMDRAFKFGNSSLDLAGDAMASSDNALKRALAFGTSGLDFAGDALMESLGFGKGAMSMVANANADAMAFADAQAKRAATQSANAYTDALAFNSDAMTKAMAMGSGVLGQGFNMISATNNLVKDAYADAKGRGALTDKMIMAAIAAMAVVAFVAVKK